jgi:hypothetical protein
MENCGGQVQGRDIASICMMSWEHLLEHPSRPCHLRQKNAPESTKSDVLRDSVCDAGDALRPFLLHAFGGLYLDLDVQCFRPTDPFLAGYDLVLQSEYRHQADVVNSVMASVPGHPFWKAIIGQMLAVRTLHPFHTPHPPPSPGVLSWLELRPG